MFDFEVSENKKENHFSFHFRNFPAPKILCSFRIYLTFGFGFTVEILELSPFKENFSRATLKRDTVAFNIWIK